MITLICGEQRWRVSIQHAERVLKIQSKIGGDWQLPENYTFANGTISRTDQTLSEGKASQKRAAKSNLAPEQAEVPHGDDTDKG